MAERNKCGGLIKWQDGSPAGAKTDTDPAKMQGQTHLQHGINGEAHEADPSRGPGRAEEPVAERGGAAREQVA